MNKEQARKEALEARDEMEAAIRTYADSLWKLQDVLSEDDTINDNVLGDVMVVAHFTPLDKPAKDNMGSFMASPHYILLNPRNLAPHTQHGLAIAAQELISEECDIAFGIMYEGDDDDRDL